MKSLECEIFALEKDIDNRLKDSFHFNAESVSNKSVYDIEYLRTQIISKAEYTKASQIILMFLGVGAAFTLNVFGNNIEENPIFTGILFSIYLILLVILVIRLNKLYRRSVELDTQAIGLIDMLIKRKERLEKEKENDI